MVYVFVLQAVNKKNYRPNTYYKGRFKFNTSKNNPKLSSEKFECFLSRCCASFIQIQISQIAIIIRVAQFGHLDRPKYSPSQIFLVRNCGPSSAEHINWYKSFLNNLCIMFVFRLILSWGNFLLIFSIWKLYPKKKNIYLLPCS